MKKTKGSISVTTRVLQTTLLAIVLTACIGIQIHTAFSELDDVFLLAENQIEETYINLVFAAQKNADVASLTEQLNEQRLLLQQVMETLSSDSQEAQETAEAIIGTCQQISQDANVLSLQVESTHLMEFITSIITIPIAAIGFGILYYYMNLRRARRTSGKQAEVIQQTILVAVTITIIASTIVYTAFNTPQPEPFNEMYILGPERKVDGYFPNDNATISTDISLTWWLQVTNSMNQPEYISLRVKLGNQSSLSPNQTTCVSADTPILQEYQWILANNQTFDTEFTWFIQSITPQNDRYSLTIQIGDEVIESSIEAVNGTGFRLIFELWTFHLETQEFQFGQETQTGISCAWGSAVV